VNAEIIVLRLVHVLGGIFWLGSGLFTTFFLMPAFKRAGPAAGPVLGALQQQRLFTVLPIVAVLTILSGLRLMWIMSAGFSAVYFASGTGRILAVSGALAIVGFLASLVIARPAMVRAGQLAGSIGTMAAGAERDAAAARIAALQRRGAIASVIAVTTVVLAGAGMAIARYVA
jgi:hypothetical protein